ncbi:hypothetical protein HYS93_04045 [Candidatus Daviesbacteria bacterium]|nr:hypothetical protein [Candidatus Daviesbacteria bacterium]
MPKLILLGLIAFIVSFVIFSQFKSGNSNFKGDITISGDYVINKDKKVSLEDGAIVRVKGNARISGEVECQDGPIHMVIEGDLTVDNNLKCLSSKNQKAKYPPGVILIVLGKLTLTKNAKIITPGSIQILNSEKDLAAKFDDITKIFDEINQDTGDGVKIGPFGKNSKKSTFNNLNLPNLWAVYASQENEWEVDGGFDLTNEPNYKPRARIVRISNKDGSIKFGKAAIKIPDGINGKDHSEDCYVDVTQKETLDEKKGKDAMRTIIEADKVVIDEFDLYLGNGGNGGSAKTSGNCYPKAYAKAGDGGEPGNFKIVAKEDIRVINYFNIHPGQGGKGGDALSTAGNGPDGCPGKPGGYAESWGGNGGDNKDDLRVLGNILGLEKVRVDSMIGGDGGEASAVSGSGGNGTKCSCKGGRGGNVSVNPGKGGKFHLVIPATAKRADGYEDKNGNDGKSQGVKGNNGKDKICDGDKTVTASPDTHKKATETKQNPKFSASMSSTDGYFITGHTAKISVSATWVVGENENYIKDYLPIKVELYINGSKYWDGVLSDTSVVCIQDRPSPNCAAIVGPTIPSEWMDTLTKYTFKLYDKSEKELPQNGI